VVQAHGSSPGRFDAAPFVGRAAELGQLDSVLERLRAGGAAVVDVTGEAGIGKSRLLEQFCVRVRSRGLTVLCGQATEHQRHSPFQPFADAFADLNPADMRRFPALAELSPAFSGTGGTASAPGTADRFGLYQATAALLGRLGHGLVVVLEDLHRADPASLELVEHLIRHPVPSALLLVLSRRERETPPALARALAPQVKSAALLRIPLGPLPEDDCVKDLAGDLSLPEARKLYRVSNGHPLSFLSLLQAHRDTRAVPGPASATTPRRILGENEPVGELVSLTTRERQVAGLVAEGLSSPAIAAELYLSPRTIETHIARIYRKTGVSSRAALASIVTRSAARDGVLRQADLSGPADPPATTAPRGDIAPQTPRAAQARRLVGRGIEVDSVARALADLKSGMGRAIALVGEPGIGKSSLLRTAAAHARGEGIPVLTAHGGRTALPTLPGGPGSVDLHEVAAHAAERAAVMAVVDDLHDLDADRVADIERLIETTTTGPVLCLLSYRQRQLSPPLAAVLSRASSAGFLEVWNLGPLSQEQARELLGDRPNLDEVHREAEGNPQYLQVLGADDSTAVDAETAILGELTGLDAHSLTLLQAAAVLDGQFHPELLAGVAGLELSVVMAALDALARLDLVRPAEPAAQLSLRHPAIGRVVYKRLEPGRRTELHHRAEAELAARAAPIAERAHHVARAADPRRPEHATTLIAAARGMIYTSPAIAKGHLQAALSLLQEGSAHWYEAKVLLARTRLLTGDASESRALLEALRSDIPGGPSGDATALADSSRIERRLGRYTEAGALARAGLAALTDDDSATAAALHAELADYAYDVQDFETSRQHAETAAALAHGHGDRVGETYALGKAALGHLFTSDQDSALTTMRKAAELLDAVPDSTLVANLEAAFQVGMAEGMLGRLVDSERHLARGAVLSRSTGQTYIHPQMLTVLGNAQLRSGNLRGALTTLDEADHHVRRIGDTATEAVLMTLGAEALFWRDGPGDLEAATATAERAMAAVGSTLTSWAVSVRCTIAEFVLRTGDPARAGWLLLDVAGGDGLPRFTAWRRPRWCESLAQVAAAEGDQAAADRWARLAEESVEQLPSAGRRGFALRARMRAEVLRRNIDGALRSAQDAIADFSNCGERLELARTLITAAALALDGRRNDAVGGWLDRAAVLAHQCGSARLAADVTTQRARLAGG
jgi:DNA-binding CsgD family transcriptional regulator